MCGLMFYRTELSVRCLFGYLTPSPPVPPGPPTGLQVVPDSETLNSLTISWTNPDFNGFSEIAGFTVNLTSRQPYDIIRDIPGDATTTTANLDSLPPFTLYTIQLSVRNAVGLEGEAATTTGMTDSAG